MRKKMAMLTLAATIATSPTMICPTVFAADSVEEAESYEELKSDYATLKKDYDDLMVKYEDVVKELESLKSEKENAPKYDISGTVKDVSNETFTVTTEKGNTYTFTSDGTELSIGQTVSFVYTGDIESSGEVQTGTVSDLIVTAEAPAGAEYDTGITYDNLSRNPDDYIGKPVKFSGTVVQLIEDTGSDEIQLRFAVDDDYDKILYCGYDKSIVSSRVLEDDWITIYGQSIGLISYESTLGGNITIPGIYIEKIDQ